MAMVDGATMGTMLNAAVVVVVDAEAGISRTSLFPWLPLFRLLPPVKKRCMDSSMACHHNAMFGVVDSADSARVAVAVDVAATDMEADMEADMETDIVLLCQLFLVNQMDDCRGCLKDNVAA